MGFHTFDPGRADKLEDPDRYRFCSVEELLGALAAAPTDVVADLGSGTGFFTDPVAAHVDTCYGVDLQPEMHDLYREKGVPDNVELVTAGMADLPFADGALDAAFSNNTFHEYHSADAIAELARVVRPGGRVVTFDWSAEGEGVAGPPMDERFDLGACVSDFEATGFRVIEGRTRSETFVCVAQR